MSESSATRFAPTAYSNLLHREWLPLDAPAWADPRLWELLVYEQAYYRDPLRRAQREHHAARFSKLVRALHGGAVPAFALASDGFEPIPLELRKSPQFQRRLQALWRAQSARSRAHRGGRPPQ